MKKYNLEEEEEVANKYYGVSLHIIERNRICMSSGQLRIILGINEKSFNDIFADLCEKQLKIKNGLSLDFNDVTNLINEAKKRKNKQVSFKLKLI